MKYRYQYPGINTNIGIGHVYQGILYQYEYLTKAGIGTDTNIGRPRTLWPWNAMWLWKVWVSPTLK